MHGLEGGHVNQQFAEEAVERRKTRETERVHREEGARERHALHESAELVLVERSRLAED